MTIVQGVNHARLGYLAARYAAVTPIAEMLDTSLETLRSKNRRPPHPTHRMLTAWSLRSVHQWQLADIAALLNCSEGTVAYYLREVERRRRGFPGDLRTECEKLTGGISSSPSATTVAR